MATTPGNHYSCVCGVASAHRQATPILRTGMLAVVPFLFCAYLLAAQTNDSDAKAGAPLQHVACDVGYRQTECQVAIAVLRKTLMRYPVEAAGKWTWVLVRTEEWKQLLSARKVDSNHCAFSYLPKRVTFLDGALVVKTSIRGAELSAMWHMTIDDLLDLAIRHELAHALCNDPDETRAMQAAVALKDGTRLSCRN